MRENDYHHLGIMAALSFVAMYIPMYAMVNAVDDVYMNVNQLYPETYENFSYLPR